MVRVDLPDGAAAMLEKSMLINQIQQINRSARSEWLDAFDSSDLRLYLDHLERSLEPRGAGSFWIRRSDTPAVVTRRAAP